jgi:hypothetical protein
MLENYRFILGDAFSFIHLGAELQLQELSTDFIANLSV